jgi:muconolactone D-isomerase
MAEFLVRTETQVAAGVDSAVVAQLRGAERERALELRASGHLKRLWRVPGRWATVGLYEAVDATELHDVVASLPMWPHTSVHVEPLAQHPQERGAQAVTATTDSESTHGR